MRGGLKCAVEGQEAALETAFVAADNHTSNAAASMPFNNKVLK